MSEEFKIPMQVKMPPLKREANLYNAKWILRNVAINNPQEMAMQAKSAVKDWLVRNGYDSNGMLEI